MKPSAAVLYDNFPPSLRRLCPGMFASLLFTLFFSIFHTLVCPDAWKLAFIGPLQKSDSKTDITNYRPMSLHFEVSLIFEKKDFHFFHNRVKGTMTPRQFSFQSRKSAVIELIDFLETVSL